MLSFFVHQKFRKTFKNVCTLLLIIVAKSFFLYELLSVMSHIAQVVDTYNFQLKFYVIMKQK